MPMALLIVAAAAIFELGGFYKLGRIRVELKLKDSKMRALLFFWIVPSTFVCNLNDAKATNQQTKLNNTKRSQMATGDAPPLSRERVHIFFVALELAE
ncbi:hypothetical protein BX661DRAFT_16214 [Kickxella alabastrina]|uniref:uncharacterized protein n=1 Tax=Kickxella alabastrina TaxID=61397 RepID=UPI002220B2B6|nr:uncharacterized protein BX661DRAFT_48352 [Kickxella alabastrina]XP_051388444.1 uncharacterized protein BX661DRAFT_16214 [Kickxella alabastrina]KAI7817690.1 hypothetical protein BX661DRAFT_48352 [Kickxella alabastrina]KAI7818756.1 hypothetical protein BX661DRAFT_16214 [Kickxella alabastrina]